MNSKIQQAMTKIVCTFVVGLASVLVAGAQTDSTNAAPPADTSAAATAVTPAAPAPAADTNAPAPVTATDTNAPAPSVPAAAPAAAVTNVTATAEDTNAPAGSNVTHGLIRFSDTKITAVIEHLARLANINYMLDPKIGYGELDANGQPKPEPVLSVRWENITAENALIALLDNYGLQMVPNKQTGIARITLKDPTAPPPLFTKVVQLKYASVSNMVDAAVSVLTDKRSKVLADTRTSQMIVVGTDPEQVAIETLVNQLDKPTRQVLIETRLIEVSSNPETKKGVDWTGTLAAQNVTFGNGKAFGNFSTQFPGVATTDPAGVANGAPSYTTGGTVTTLTGGGGFNWNTKSGATPDIGFLNADGLSAVLSFLNTSKDAQVMSTPRVVTLDNEMATINVYRTYPIFTTTAGTANTAGGSSINYSNVGTSLHVTPRISANDYIWLKVIPEVSSFFGNFVQVVPNTGTTGGSSTVTAPQFDVRSVQTQVLIPNSNTLVLGGLVQDNPSTSSTKVPLLGDIPGLGYFFKSSDKIMNKDNLLIFITPTIVKDTDFHASTSGEFLKSKPQPMKDSMDPKSAWDGTEPAGTWSDPISDNVK